MGCVSVGLNLGMEPAMHERDLFSNSTGSQPSLRAAEGGEFRGR